MKLCAKWDLVPRAWAFVGQDVRLVRLKMGSLLFLVDINEAREFAREIIAAADEASDPDSTPKDCAAGTFGGQGGQEPWA
jgi:hypothetical protein